MITMKHCLRSDNAEQNANKGSFNYRISGLHVNTHDLIIPVKLMAPRYWILMCKLPHCTLFRCWPRCLVCYEVSRTFMTLTCFGGHNADGTPPPPPQQALANGSHTLQWQGRAHRWLPTQGRGIELEARRCEGSPPLCPFHFSMFFSTY